MNTRRTAAETVKTNVGDVGVGDVVKFTMGPGHNDEAEVTKLDTAYKDLTNKGRFEVIDKSKRILWVYPKQVKEIRKKVASRLRTLTSALVLTALSESEMRRAFPPKQQDDFKKMFSNSLEELVVRSLVYKAKKNPEQIERIKRLQYIQTIASGVFGDLKKMYDKMMDEVKSELSVNDVLETFGEHVGALMRTTR